MILHNWCFPIAQVHCWEVQSGTVSIASTQPLADSRLVFVQGSLDVLPVCSRYVRHPVLPHRCLIKKLKQLLLNSKIMSNIVERNIELNSKNRSPTTLIELMAATAVSLCQHLLSFALGRQKLRCHRSSRARDATRHFGV